MPVNYHKGFTLIEIIVALAVVAIAVLSMMDSMNTHVHVSSELEKTMVSRWVASNVIAETRYQANIDKIKTGRSSETVRMGEYQWRARSIISETDVENVFLLTVEVSDQEGRGDKPLSSLTTALSGPGDL